MDESIALAFVREHIPKMSELLGVEAWWIDAEFKPTSIEGSRAEVYMNPPYRRATIRFDLTQYPAGDTDRLYRSLRHELIHLVLSEFCALEQVAKDAVGDDKPVLAMIDSVSHLATERSVLAVEVLLDRILPISKMRETTCLSSPPQTPKPSSTAATRSGRSSSRRGVGSKTR